MLEVEQNSPDHVTDRRSTRFFCADHRMTRCLYTFIQAGEFGLIFRFLPDLQT